MKKHQAMIIRVFIFLFLVSAIPGFALSPGDEIRKECGGRARITWCQDAGDGSDAGAQGNSLRLMGLDTDDGRGERCVLPNLSNYAKPMLTPDGNKIIFSNRQEQKIYMVGFDGSGLKELAAGFALAVWCDVLTGTDWVYAGTMVNQADAVMINVRRFRLDKPEVSEPVWSKTPLNIDNFQLSADGRYASGLFPWPACGLATLPDREWKKIGDGCWPSLSPDKELLFWIFDGAHRNLTMFQTKTGERWVVNINYAPGIDGFEVYHPRWGNHPRFMTMTGPYKLGEGDNRIRGGGTGVEIYLGKFSSDFRKIERWIQVTHNKNADFFPDLWISAPKKTTEPEAFTLPPESDLHEKKKASVDTWPGSFENLVFFWQNRSKANTFTDPITMASHVCRAEAKGRARYGRHFEMAPSGGAFIADGGSGELIDRCAASGQLGLEALITPGDGNYYESSKSQRTTNGLDSRFSPGRSAPAEPGRGNDNMGMPGLSFPARPGIQYFPATDLTNLYSNGKTNLLPIIGYAAGQGVWNFLLGQQGRRLVLKLKVAGGGPDYLVPLADLSGGKAVHVIVSCSTSSVACYLDGELLLSKNAVQGGNWQGGKIVFGNEWRGEYLLNSESEKSGWKGLIENVALYSRWIGPEEARKKHKAIAGNMGVRKQAPVISVVAKLISSPAIPSPESIAPYRRALAVGQYRVEKTVTGTCTNKEIMVARWVILDAQRVKKAEYRSGEAHQLRLEQFSDHPELEGERLIMDGEGFDLPLYYDID